jgi:hypothetical protein
MRRSVFRFVRNQDHDKGTPARAAFTLLAAWLLRFCSGALHTVQCPSCTSPAAVSAAVGARLGACIANARSHQGRGFFTL